VCHSKYVEPSINFGIINFITKLHLVDISTESSTMHGSMNIKSIFFIASYRLQQVEDVLEEEILFGTQQEFSTVIIQVFNFSQRRISVSMQRGQKCV
jgi:hypothetical protein